MLDYSNPVKFMQYPFTNGDSFTDTYSGPAELDGEAYYQRSGSITVTADGFGTVITPEGAVPNVLRVHSVETHTDNPSLGSNIDFVYDTYKWLAPGIKVPILTVTHYTRTSNGTVFEDTYTGVVGSFEGIGMVEGQANSFGAAAWPNPATGSTDLLFSCGGGLDLTISLLDATGREVRSWQQVTTAPGIQRRALDLIGLAPGAHLVRIMDTNGKASTCRLVTF